MPVKAFKRSAGEAATVPLLYKPEEAADLLRLSRTRVYDLMRRGEIRSVKIGGLRRIPASDLIDYVAGLERDAA
jgi:excisionase family DNA binding protein